MSITATFIGENADGFVELWGYRFETAKPVKVTNPHAIQKIKGNSEFTHKPAKGADAGAAALDHDNDGKAGGSKRGAASTAAKGKAKRSAQPASAGETPPADSTATSEAPKE